MVSRCAAVRVSMSPALSVASSRAEILEPAPSSIAADQEQGHTSNSIDGQDAGAGLHDLDYAASPTRAPKQPTIDAHSA